MESLQTTLSEFLAEVVMTGYYLAEPPRKSTALLHDAEMKCLKIVATFGPLQMHEVARLLHATKPRATQLVTVLQNYGYVTRLNGVDHRVKLVSVTDAGAHIVHDARQKYDALAAEIIAKLGKTEAARLCDILARITPLTSNPATKEEPVAIHETVS